MTYIIMVVKDNYAKRLLIGFVSIFVAQFLWNISMNLGLAPISGVGLLFISFGGSQMIFSAAVLGIMLSVYKLRNIQHLSD